MRASRMLEAETGTMVVMLGPRVEGTAGAMVGMEVEEAATMATTGVSAAARRRKRVRRVRQPRKPRRKRRRNRKRRRPLQLHQWPTALSVSILEMLVVMLIPTTNGAALRQLARRRRAKRARYVVI